MAIKYPSNLAWFGIERQNLGESWENKVHRTSKFGVFLENEVHWKSKLSKYVNDKSWPPIFVFFNEKKI